MTHKAATAVAFFCTARWTGTATCIALPNTAFVRYKISPNAGTLAGGSPIRARWMAHWIIKAGLRFVARVRGIDVCGALARRTDRQRILASGGRLARVRDALVINPCLVQAGW